MPDSGYGLSASESKWLSDLMNRLNDERAMVPDGNSDWLHVEIANFLSRRNALNEEDRYTLINEYNRRLSKKQDIIDQYQRLLEAYAEDNDDQTPVYPHLRR